MELTLCVEAVHRLSSLWEVSTDEDRQGMARNLFNYVIFDLDTHRIVDFRLKPWADRFVTLRAALYEEVKGLERTIMFSQGQYTEVALTGSELRGQPIAELVNWFMSLSGFRKLRQSLSRDELIRLRHSAGEGLSNLAREFGISPQRVFQIAKANKE